MWLRSGVPWTTRARRNIGARKQVIWICFWTSGRHVVVILLPGEKFDRDFFIDEVLARCDEHPCERRKIRDQMALFCRLTKTICIWFNRNLTRWAFTDYPILLSVRISHHAIFGFSDTSRWSLKDVLWCTHSIFNKTRRNLRRH
jgi:hypothetical protein